jgi:hypothetical protein
MTDRTLIIGNRQLSATSGVVVPTVIKDAGPDTIRRFVEFFMSVPARKWAIIPEPGEPLRNVAIPVGDHVRWTQMADRLQRNDEIFLGILRCPMVAFAGVLG